MRKNSCEVVRRELDELMLGEACSASVVVHLKECVACREFQQTQTKLRQMIGSIGTVVAPADFDFRLRARLANDASVGVQSAYRSLARRAFVAATLLIVFGAGAVLVRNVVNQQKGNEVAAENVPPIQQESPKRVQQTASPEQIKELTAQVPARNSLKIKSERPAQTGSKTKRSLVAVDLASERAEVISVKPDGSDAFPIDASLQSLKFSLDDGRGNAKTISVPTIRFGSQRMLPNGNQFAQKGIW